MLEFLERHEYLILFFSLFGVLFVAAMLEWLLPRREEPGRLGYRWSNNLGLWMIDQLNVTWVTSLGVVYIAWWTEGQNVGFLGNFELGFWTHLLIAILVFELIAYAFHRALHSIPWLWRLHIVHHTDTYVDFSTTYRAHPIELFLIAPLTVPAVVLLGTPAGVMVAYQFLRQTISIIAHSNIKLPEALDNWLRLVIVTPDYHRLHHSSQRRYTDSNYCAAFSFYDYLFGTATKIPYADQETLETGLEYFRSDRDSRIDRLLIMPFIPKEQWRRPSESFRAEKPAAPLEASR